MKNILAKAVLTVAFLILPLTAVKGAEYVNAVISPFENNIVYTDFYNYAVEYPVLFHNDILYIPLTSSMCCELHLSIAFTPEDGLYVARGGSREFTGQERQQVLGAIEYVNPANGRVSAVIPEYPVYINGRQYDNVNTEYPLLNFRDITYLPLTYDIIYNEFDFDFSFDGTKLTLAGNSWYSAPYVTESNEDYIEFEEHKSVYSESLNEYGDIRYTLQYSYDEYHRLNLSDDTIIKMPEDYKPTEKPKVSEKEQDPRFTVKDNYAYFEDARLVQLPKWSGDGWSYEGYASAEIYDYDDTSFIVVTTGVHIALPRGTTREYHIFVKDESGITELDWKYVFTDIIYDGSGAWYLCSSSGNQSYGNNFAEIYRYTKENGLERLSDRYENINSLEYIGTHNGKMYVFAALRDGNRDVGYSGESLNPMHSGYYVIDENLNIAKISPYMGARAEAILAENGNLYVITNYSSRNRLINLNTGEIVHTF